MKPRAQLFVLFLLALLGLEGGLMRCVYCTPEARLAGDPHCGCRSLITEHVGWPAAIVAAVVAASLLVWLVTRGGPPRRAA
jgi:hypothetical protein